MYPIAIQLTERGIESVLHLMESKSAARFARSLLITPFTEEDLYFVWGPLFETMETAYPQRIMTLEKLGENFIFEKPQDDKWFRLIEYLRAASR